MAVLAPMVTLGCNMLNLGQGSSDTGSSTTGSSKPTNANLGDFTLKLKMTQSSCGQGALGLENQFSFDVSLSHDGDTGQWTSGGATIDGAFDPDAKTLDFTSSVTTDMRKNDPPGTPTKPACSVERIDDAAFTLDSATHPTSLTGQLTYSYAATTASNCADLIYSQTPTFQQLPCTVTYSVSGALKTATK